MDRIKLVSKLLQERRKAVRGLRRYMETEREYLPGKALLMREAHFLVAIEPEGSTGTEISQRLEYSLSAISQLANRLEKKGLITRTTVAEDKRQSLFSLTEEGVALKLAHTEYDKAGYQKMSDKLAQYSDREIEDLIEYERIAANLYTVHKNKDVK